MASTSCVAAGALRGWVLKSACLQSQKRMFAICPLRPSLHKGTVYYRVPNPYIPVLLLRSVRGVGVRGQLVQVRRGLLRNFLMPQKLAVVATWQNIDRHHILAQEATKVKPDQTAERPATYRKDSLLSFPAVVFDQVGGGASSGALAESGDAHFPLQASSLQMSGRGKDIPQRHFAESVGGIRNVGTTRTSPRTAENGVGMQEPAATTSLGEDELDRQTSAGSKRAEGPFGFLRSYCARFVVNTDRADPAVARGKGISVYDILSRLSQDVKLDLLPQQAKLTLARVKEDSTERYLDEDHTLKSSRETAGKGVDLAKRPWKVQDSKGNRTLDGSGEEMDKYPVLTTCGLYEARVSLPRRHGAVARRQFTVELVSKQAIARLLREKLSRQKDEASKTDFSLGPEL